MSADRIESLVNLTNGMADEARAALLRAIADLIESYPLSTSPWDSELMKFSDPNNAPNKQCDDKPENRPADDMKQLRDSADRFAPKTSGTTRPAGSGS